MENQRWLDILVKRSHLEAEDVKITSITDTDPFYLVEGVKLETVEELSFLVYDFSASDVEAPFPYDTLMRENDDHVFSRLVLVFKNRPQERTMYWNYYDKLSFAAERKQFSRWFDQHISIYTDSGANIRLQVNDDGINYLEYPEKNHPIRSDLQGRIYNLSFFELKKLYDAMGNDLFQHNVRYGLRTNPTGARISSHFREYLSVALYEKSLRAAWPVAVREALRDALELDDRFIAEVDQPQETDESILTFNILRPENFWFYHNGISIFVEGGFPHTLGDQIVLEPNRVSVINGAQTISNFYGEVEAMERRLAPVLRGAGEEKHQTEIKEAMDLILKGIYVKTVLLSGNDAFIRPITHGLNTQIPILEETRLANSVKSDKINTLLANDPSTTHRVKILKDGEIWAGEYGLNILDFVKNWLVICGHPGKSKNFRKAELDQTLNNALSTLQPNADRELYLKKLISLLSIYQWWDAAKKTRIDDHPEDPEALTVGKYGKNYFGSYVLSVATSLDQLDDAMLELLYDRFLLDVTAVAGSDLSLNAFKKDDLFKKMMSVPQQPERPIPVISSLQEADIRDLLNKEGQSPYTYLKTITDYLHKQGILLDYFRVISRIDGDCKEAFPFPNSTFNEIVNAFDSESIGDSPKKLSKKGPAYKSFEDSAFAQAISRTFPVFVIDRTDTKDPVPTGQVNAVHFIAEFSFVEFRADAKKTYDQTIEAFRCGDVNKFPQSSSGVKFHIRPKAMDATDTFLFTNGDYITKRTFWANKKTVDSLLAQMDVDHKDAKEPL